MRPSPLALAVVPLVLAVAGCGAGDEPALRQGSEPVRLEPADFVARIDNPYWPMAPGSRYYGLGTGPILVVGLSGSREELIGFESAP